MFQVSLRVDVNDMTVLLPRELHDLKTATSVGVPRLQLLINLHDHFMGK